MKTKNYISKNHEQDNISLGWDEIPGRVLNKTKKNLALTSSQINYYINPDSTLNTISQINHPSLTLHQTYSTLTISPRVASCQLGGCEAIFPNPNKKMNHPTLKGEASIEKNEK